MPTIREDIAGLKDEIAGVKSDIKLGRLDQTYTKATVKRIENAINKMAYISKEEYTKDQLLVNKRLDALEKTKEEDAPGRWFSKEAMKLFIQAVSAVGLGIIGFFLAKVGLK